MINKFDNIEDLMYWVQEDKLASGTMSMSRDRYPIRFVLFDNFRDSYDFVELMTKRNCIVESVNNWIKEPYSDSILTYSKLVDEFKLFVKGNMGKQDFVVTPFSELARFYDNEERFEFNTLVSTLKSIESDVSSIQIHQRFYIPIVGLEGKMSKFYEDSQTFICYFKNSDRQLNYNLIVTNGTDFSVKGLEKRYTVVNNMMEWLSVWRNQNAKTNIVSTSPTIFTNARYAQPDNAFAFYTCENVYSFLVNGLHLDFGSVTYKPAEEEYWCRLASEIDVEDFSFEKFFNTYFHIDNLSDYTVFIKTWFECKDSFEKWLLCSYYTAKFCNKGYICETISQAQSFANYDFFSSMLLSIFDMENKEDVIEERKICLDIVSLKNISITEDTKNRLRYKLFQLANSEGYTKAICFFTAMTNVEKGLAIEWLGKNLIPLESVQSFYPDLVSYLSKTNVMKDADVGWMYDYLHHYKMSKLSNSISNELNRLLQHYNKSQISFNQWYQKLRNTKTILLNRQEIDVYYWIDGLGAEWMPFVADYIRHKENMFLNEMYLARANFPTTTSVNKVSLQELAGEKLRKIGDLDSHAHQNKNCYPDYLIEEIQIVKEALDKIVGEYAGSKIAIISDHGLTALSQFCDGYNMAGVESDHNGRVAIRSVGINVSDEHYAVCDDNKTLCALQHSSLCAKIPAGQSAHGGCTPEEILVPIFIISSQKVTTSFSATLQTPAVSASSPVVRYIIKGVSAADIMYVEYNGQHYELSSKGQFVYETDRLSLVNGVDELFLHVNNQSQKDIIEFKTGAVEDDLFDL